MISHNFKFQKIFSTSSEKGFVVQRQWTLSRLKFDFWTFCNENVIFCSFTDSLLLSLFFRFGGRGGGNFRGGDNRRDIDIRDRDFGDNRRGGGGFDGFDRRDGGDDRRGGRGNEERRGRGDRAGGRNRSRSPRDKSV